MHATHTCRAFSGMCVIACRRMPAPAIRQRASLLSILTAWHPSVRVCCCCAAAVLFCPVPSCRFKLQEVRHDPQHHPYLQQPSLQAWQSCAVNAASPTTGIACLRQLARKVEGGPHALHVFVGGSRDERAYCSADAVAMGSGCRSVAPGYSSARGPWKGVTANVNWKEESVPDNFVFLSW